MYRFILLTGFLLTFGSLHGIHSLERIDMSLLSPGLKQAVDSIVFDKLANNSSETELTIIDKQTLKVTLQFEVKEPVEQDDWKLTLYPAFTPTFNWAPHLTPTGNHVIDQHVFRSPALIIADRKQVLVMIPDLDLLKEGNPVRWYMDMNATNNQLVVGMSNTRPTDHILFEKTTGASYPSGKVEIGFYLLNLTDRASVENPFRKSLEFMWNKWGHPLYASGEPLKGDLSAYVNHTYNWAFNSWSDQVWQEFTLNGKRVGAPVFIVNTTQSPNFQGEVNEREFRSIWNQAWFSSLRSASGLYRHARRTGNHSLSEKAVMTKELALQSPQINGFFYGLIGTEMEQQSGADGRLYRRSKGWDTYYWGNSNRNPYTGDARISPFHVLDMSWTALLMIRWYDELEKDERLLKYAEKYAGALVKLQYPNGFFPAWLRTDTQQPLDQLNDSPETSMSVTFLLKLYELTGNETYKSVALKAMNAVIKEIIPYGRWEDFETYWSCSRYGSGHITGRKEIRNNMHKQCNFSMFWTAEALLESYRLTGHQEYLVMGRRTLDELLMTQASWQPPYIYVPALGGFGVMNADGEWNDSRGSLFAELILQYGKLLSDKEYIERGTAALKASFVMMYCPENPGAKAQWEKAHSFFGPEDYGFTMENYGHGGITSPHGAGMGDFTIYDWGNGAAAEAYNRILDKFGKIEN